MDMTDEKFILDKSIWTESDFEIMGWHDARIFGWTLGDYELILDIDYIFKWIHPKGEEKYFKFWIAPCTLVFENVHSLIFDLDIDEPFEIEIADIRRENPQRPKNADYIKREVEYEWTIDTQQGQVTFKSVGYKQYVRQSPQFCEHQELGMDRRGGISFSKTHFLK